MNWAPRLQCTVHQQIKLAHCTHQSDLCLTVYRHVMAAEPCKVSTPDRSCRCCVVCDVCCIHEEVCTGYGCGAHMPQCCLRAAAVSMQGPALKSRRHAEFITLFCGARRHHRVPGKLMQRCGLMHFILEQIDTLHLWYADCKRGPHTGPLRTVDTGPKGRPIFGE